MFLLLHVADRTTITCSPSLFIYLSLSLHLSVALHTDTRALPAVCIRCLKYLLSCCLCLFQTLQLHIAHGRLLFPFTHIMSVCLQFLFFSTFILFLSYPFSLNVRDLIVYRNHKFGCHSGARCVSFLTF